LARQQLLLALKADPNFVPSKKALAIMSPQSGMPLLDQIQTTNYTESASSPSQRSLPNSRMTQSDRSNQTPAATIQSPEPLPLNMTRQ
jgi:hypothetical protein